MKYWVLVITLSACVFALMYGAAAAITITFNDLTDTVTADVTDLPAGVTSSTSLGPGEKAVVTISGAFLGDGFPSQFLLAPFALTEDPVGSALPIISDLIEISEV